MLQQLSTALGESQASLQIQSHHWVVPAVQSVHILAIAILAFTAFSTGFATARGRIALAPPAGEQAFGWLWAALLALLLSGAVLIVGEPNRTLMNLFFRVKMVLLVAAVTLTMLLQRRLSREGSAIGGTGARLTLGALPIVLWLGIIFCGRLIAYFGALTPDA
jgi:hypothetical protein